MAFYKSFRLLVFILYIAIRRVTGVSENSVFIVTNHQCITNSSSALSFTTPVDQTAFDVVSSFYPSSTNDLNVNCKINNNEICTSTWINEKWTLQNSIDGNINQVITDWRWEDFQVHITDFVSNYGAKLKFVNAVVLNKDSFEIPISVRIKQDAHVFLCDGYSLTSTCYWVMLQAWSKTRSALRKCPGNIPLVQNKYPQGSCATILSEITHDSYSEILHETVWSHFKIKKKGGLLTVTRNDKEILRYNDPDESVTIKSLWFHSKVVNGLWKLHKYTYLYCSEEITTQLGPQHLQIRKGQSCISMFIVMCSKCQLLFRLVDNSGETVYSNVFTTEDEKWTEIKLLINSEEDVLAKLYATTTSTDTSEFFWAIDNIRECKDNEYRILQILQQENVPCQLVERDNSFDITQEIVSNSGISCPETAFGTTCIPCTILGRSDCANFKKYCDSFNGDRMTCFCTPGFRTDTCEKQCRDGTYGHGCKKTCGNCYGDCNHITGNCYTTDCRNQFRGPKCDIPPEGILKYPPEIVKEEITSCTVRVSNFEIIGTNTPKFYKIQYREARKDSTWIDIGSAHNFNDVAYEIIVNLKPDTEYYVRAVLFSDRYNIYPGDTIKQSSFQTECNSLQPENIYIMPTDTSSTINFQSPSNPCKLHNYAFSVNGSRQERIQKEPIEIYSLQPCIKYNFSVSHIYNGKSTYKIFTTAEGVPSRINAFQVTYPSSTSIALSWQKPENQNCKITQYAIEYKRINPIACNYLVSDPSYTEVKVAETFTTLFNLQPYSKYEIKVSAVTKAGKGEAITTEVNTVISDELAQDEVPYITDKNISTQSVTIFLSMVECSKMRGPIYVNLNVQCQTEWCIPTQKNHTFKYNPVSPRILISGLSAFVNYTLTQQISRNSSDWTKAKTTTDQFITNPTVPNEINSVEVTTKDGNSITLRWKPPYPPTGILERYYIKYKTENSVLTWNYEDKVEPSPCKLWPSYHCTTIKEGVKEGWEYHVQIWANNELPKRLARITITDTIVKAETDVPEPPYDESQTWTVNNDLKLTWKHPNATNGILTKFEIDFVQNNDRKAFDINIRSEDDYKLTYSYKIKREELDIKPCSKYTLLLTAHNKDHKGYAAVINDWSPPPMPPSVSSGTLKTNSTNHTITVRVPCPKCNKRTIVNINSKLYMFISNSSNRKGVFDEMVDFENSLWKSQDNLIETRYSRLVLETYQNKLPITFKIGTDNATEFESKNFSNPPLELGKKYSLNLFYVNECYGKVRIAWINQTVYTTGDPSVYLEKEPISDTEDGNKGLYALILLIFLIPLIGFAYIYLKKNKRTPAETLTVLKQAPSYCYLFCFAAERKNDDQIPLTEKPAKGNVGNPTIKPQGVQSENPPVILQTTHSKPIKLSDFEAYLKEAIQNEELARQHGLFPRGQTKPWDYGVLKVNKAKNRYNNLIAYDHTRVKLRKIAGVDHSDYINANYVDGYKTSRAYIATQAPKAATLNDFWRMIWQHSVKNIVMLANIYESGKKKVEKYWPDINEERDFNGVKVQYISSEVFANYEYRVFNVCNNNEQRRVEQLHFTTWPDHGVPLYSQSLVPFLQKMLKIPNSTHSPVVVHCSAGVGRTGTIILCDICLRMAAAEGSVDFLANLEHLRSQRPNMVDNIEQYKLAHLVVLECLFGMHTSIVCNDDMDKTVESLINNGAILNHMRYLEDTEWQDKAMDTVWVSEEAPPVYTEKNRVDDILPDPHHRVFLTRYPPEDETSSYINAVQVDGFRNPGRFLVTQQPMPNTVGDFWRLVFERKTTVIISLNEVNLNDETSCQFWPEEGTEMNPVDYLKVYHADTTVLGCYRIIKVHLINQTENENMAVTIVSMSNWMPGDLLPNSIEEFLSFWEDSDALSRQSDPVIITCYDGATASGLYIAISFLIEKMKLEQECDVCLAVRTIRHCRKQFVSTEEQFEFLYRASVTYINGFQSYANFA